MIELLKRNVIPILFFGFIAAGLFSYLDFREGQKDIVRDIITYNRENISEIQFRVTIIESKTTISKDTEEDYQDIMSDFESLNEYIVQSKENLPNQVIDQYYEDYREKTLEYYEEYQKSVLDQQELFERKHEIIPYEEEFRNTTVLTEENIDSHFLITQYLADATAGLSDSSGVKIANNFLDEALFDGKVDEEEKQRYTEIRTENNIFLPEGHRLINFTDIDDEEVLDKYEGFEKVEEYLIGLYGLRDLIE